MEKPKKITNKMKWTIFVVIMLSVIIASATIYVIGCTKSEGVSANANVADNLNTQKENLLNQEELVDTSKMSEEQLKKLNEEEQKKLEEKEKDKKENKTTKKKKNKYYIKVNYGAQVVTIYTYDKNGKYTVPVRACICSTGAATPPSGVYNIGYKWVWGKLYGNVWGHYTSQIVGDILFHSVPYMKAKNDTLVSTYYDRLGRKDSMGCVRLTTIDAKWIFENCPSGTQVEFYSSSNPGPLGKPTATKVSNAPGNLKKWDPTDPDSRNPWKTYKPNEEKPNKDNKEDEKPKEEETTPPVNTDIEKPVDPTVPTTDPEEKDPNNPDNPDVEKPDDTENAEKPDTPNVEEQNNTENSETGNSDIKENSNEGNPS